VFKVKGHTSYAYDDGADSIFTCGGCGGGGDTTYAISFCPSTTRYGREYVAYSKREIYRKIWLTCRPR
jgi:hypothetical protein